MPKIVMSDVRGGYNLSAIEENFDKIATELNDKVLYRNNPPLESNTVHNDVDMNGNRIYNLPAPNSPSEPARLQDLQNVTGGGGVPSWNDITGKPTTFPPSSHTHVTSEVTGLDTALANKQDTLVSGTNIKTINGSSILGSGDLVVAGGSGGANLTTSVTSTSVTINSDSGTDATISAASATDAGVMTAAEQVKLAGVQAGATANDTDANLKNRANHTGTQLANTISDFAETVDDRVASLLVAGSNITLTYNDVANSLTIAAASSGTGDVVGPASATDNAIVRFDATTGKLIQNSGVLIADDDTLTVKGVKETVVSGTVTASTYTIVAANGTIYDLTLGNDVTFTFPTPAPGLSFTLILTQSAATAWLVSLPASVRGPGNSNTFTMTPTLSRTDIVSFVAKGTYWMMLVGGQNYNLS